MIFFIITNSNLKNEKENIILGTYITNDLPFDTMVFDHNSNFYYYNDNICYKGKLLHKNEINIISTPSSNKVVIPKNNGEQLLIKINNRVYKFTRLSKIPIFILK